VAHGGGYTGTRKKTVPQILSKVL